MEISNLEESLSGPIPSSFYRTIALAEENDVELGVKLRIAESNLAVFSESFIYSVFSDSTEYFQFLSSSPEIQS